MRMPVEVEIRAIAVALQFSLNRIDTVWNTIADHAHRLGVQPFALVQINELRFPEVVSAWLAARKLALGSLGISTIVHPKAQIIHIQRQSKHRRPAVKPLPHTVRKYEESDQFGVCVL